MGGGGGGMGMGGAGSGGGGGFAEFGGVDPSMDPELAMALRVSMEEERARQERVAAAAAAASGGGEEAKTGDEADGGVPAAAESTNATAFAADNGGEMNDEDALLQQALAMSMAENQASASEDIEMDSAEMDMTGGGGDEDDEDAAMQMALAMSMQGERDEVGPVGQQFQDPAFVNQVLKNKVSCILHLRTFFLLTEQLTFLFSSPFNNNTKLLGSLPGVNPDDPAIQEALHKANEDKTEKKENNDDGKGSE